MIEFKGVRTQIAEYNTVIFTIDGERWANLPLYLDEKNHSPTGFEWGYMGSGPSQLSYAILRTYFRVTEGDDTPRQAENLYMKFKEDVISRIITKEWLLTGEMITKWLKELREKNGRYL